jgi:antitoxin (DNA-binding transcriptional repressor) of toxin-antitoxin stability system
MRTILNRTEAKAMFSGVAARIRQGERSLVTRMGHPIARVTR